MQTELVDRARRGDREAFGVLAAGAIDRLYAIARLILRDTELAEDATQDALVHAWRNLPTLRGGRRTRDPRRDSEVPAPLCDRGAQGGVGRR